MTALDELCGAGAVTEMISAINIAWHLLIMLMDYGAMCDDMANWAKLNEICGMSVTDRIIGGTNAAIGQYPWIAHLGIMRELNC